MPGIYVAPTYSSSTFTEGCTNSESRSIMTTLSSTPISKLRAGTGRISVSLHGSSVFFPELSSTYPLKLLAPRISQHGVAVVYILTYGGGLVGGDHIALSVNTGPGAVLVLLSQVSHLQNAEEDVNSCTVGIYEGIQKPPRAAPRCRCYR